MLCTWNTVTQLYFNKIYLWKKKGFKWGCHGGVRWWALPLVNYVGDCSGTFTMGVISMESSRLLRASVMALLQFGINWQAVSTLWGSEPLRLETSSWCGGTHFPSTVVWCCCGQERPLEPHHPWSTDQRCAGCPQWPLATSGSAKIGVHLVGPHRGCCHPPNSLQGPAVLQCIPIPGAQPAAPWVYPGCRLPQLSAISWSKWPHHHHGSASSVLSPIIYLEGKAGSQVALGPFREGLYSVPLSQVGCGVP